MATADVVRGVAEKRTPIRKVAHILKDGAAVGIGLRSAEIFLGCLRKLFQEERFDVRFPSRIDDGFVRENSVSVNGSRQCQQSGDQANDDHSSASKKMIRDSG